MMQVNDLNIDADILPLFNFTNNDYAAAELKKLFREIPASVEAVTERQQILQGFLQNWAILENFTYPRLYLNEVYALFQKIMAGSFNQGTLGLKARVRLHFSETQRNQKKSQLIQVVLLLDNIYRRYLLRLDKAKFPAAFKQHLEQGLLFLGNLNLPRYAGLITEDKLSITDVLAFYQKLHHLSSVEVTTFWQFFFSFEAYYSIARAIRQYHFSFPAFQAQQFMLQAFYHPLVPNPVKNNICLNPEENTVLLTGPNMSGKSTLLKAVGLCVYLAHIGLAVPATSCQIPFYDNIAIHINVNDSLRNGYSHFMAEIINLKIVLEAANAGEKCFAIFDELFKGTNIDDAQEITLTTINGLTKLNNSLFFVSTHLIHLQNQLPSATPAIGKYYIDCQLEAGAPLFTYALKKGWSDLKIGKILFQKEGLTQLLGKL